MGKRKKRTDGDATQCARVDGLSMFITWPTPSSVLFKRYLDNFLNRNMLHVVEEKTIDSGPAVASVNIDIINLAVAYISPIGLTEAIYVAGFLEKV